MKCNNEIYSATKKPMQMLTWISIWVICAIFCINCLYFFHKNDPVGLFVVKPNIEFFQCAKEVHGNYQFYYAPGIKEFMFIRNDELCSVNTMAFREHYIKLYGRNNEIFIGE